MVVVQALVLPHLMVVVRELRVKEMLAAVFFLLMVHLIKVVEAVVRVLLVIMVHQQEQELVVLE